jgi:hypothetical protein
VASIWNAQGFAKSYLDYAEEQGYGILIFAETKGKANRLEPKLEYELGAHT